MEDLLCDGCGTVQVLAPGIDYYCPNKKCDWDKRQMYASMRQNMEHFERLELTRLKAKYE